MTTLCPKFGSEFFTNAKEHVFTYMIHIVIRFLRPFLSEATKTFLTLVLIHILLIWERRQCTLWRFLKSLRFQQTGVRLCKKAKWHIGRLIGGLVLVFERTPYKLVVTYNIYFREYAQVITKLIYVCIIIKMENMLCQYFCTN